MVNDVFLTGILNKTLTSITRTQRALDQTSLRLATGLKVNSALDNPQNFFASKSLSDRSNDIQRLLDDMGQNIRTLQETDTGIRALTGLIEQADAIAQEAVSLTAQTPTEAKIAGNVDLRGIDDLTTLGGINDGDAIVLTLRDPDSIIYFPPAATITINTGDTAEDIVATINSLNAGLNTKIIEARLDASGGLEIKALDGNILNIEFDAVGAVNDANNLALATELGFGDSAKLLGDGFGNNEVQLTVVPTRTLTSFQLFNTITNETAVASDEIDSIEGENNTLLFFGINDVADAFEIGFNGGARQSIVIGNNQTIQGLIDGINNNTSLNGFIEADFLEETGQITISAIDPSVETIETALESNGIAVSFFGFNVSIPLRFLNADVDSIRLGSVGGPSAETISLLERDYDKILDEINNIVDDAHYRGINLLKSDDMETFFNEDRSNSQITEGVDFTSLGLGFEDADFSTQAGAALARTDAREALKTVREFGRAIANQLSVIQTRQDFSEKTINTLEAGADDLTVADANKEGANMLATQTRLDIAQTSLSLSAQLQSAILSLFNR